MNRFFKLLAPISTLSVVFHIVMWIGLIAVVNICFALAVDGVLQQPLSYYLAHAVFVRGPFLIFVTMVTRYQLRLQKHLSLLSRKDGLTGLNNRRTFIELASKRHEDSTRGVLLLLDADHFKRVNDMYGHAVGDTCLMEIAHRLKWNLRPEDVAGRIGGEEFAVLLASATIEQARVIAGRIGQPIPFRANDHNAHLTITLSIGGILIDPELSLDAHLIRADEALYAAKDAGRARLIMWTEALGSAALRPSEHSTQTAAA